MAMRILGNKFLAKLKPQKGAHRHDKSKGRKTEEANQVGLQ